MPEACIVCLGDLFELPTEEDAAATAQTSTATNPPPSPSKATSTVPDIGNDPQAIAHLLPCQHNLHNECLKPWVERANSCPICRQSFNLVELRASLNGPCVSNYAVRDKQQIPDIDPSMVVDDDEELFDEPSVEPCLLCQRDGNDDLLLLCDGCNGSCHTYCVGLDGVPAGAWFCPYCMDDGTSFNTALSRSTTQRTRGQQRARRLARDGSPTAWARVWQSVWDSLNLDLDFPFDEDAETEQLQQQRSAAERREIREWQRRFQVAERQGGAARFRDTATALLDTRAPRQRTPTPSPESQEELRAWNAFEKARELERQGLVMPRGRKRRSSSSSPSEPAAPEPQRQLKRPRTRRLPEHAESSAAGARRATNEAVPALQTSIPREELSPSNVTPNANSPTFFQSLLREVESGPGSATNGAQETRRPSRPPPLDIASPGSPSQASSPSSSNLPSPRGRSVSPNLSRPASPPPLTSSIRPLYRKPQQAFSPRSPRQRGASDSEETSKPRSTRQSRSREKLKGSSERRSHSEDASPTRVSMPFEAKMEIQKMVAAALKPAYKKQEIDTDQYTEINKTVSRKLYDQIGEKDILLEGDLKDRWQGIAEREVSDALKSLSLPFIASEG